ncbi:hypothetical protein AOLI_G00057290 [Acnodon oligacanthus]
MGTLIKQSNKVIAESLPRSTSARCLQYSCMNLGACRERLEKMEELMQLALDNLSAIGDDAGLEKWSESALNVKGEHLDSAIKERARLDGPYEKASERFKSALNT